MIYSTSGAFAAKNLDGTVVTWPSVGEASSSGGDSSAVASELTSVEVIYAGDTAFAAKKLDGTVVTWGKPAFGGDSSSVASDLNSVDTIYPSGKAFAAKKLDGSVVTGAGSVLPPPRFPVTRPQWM